MPRMDWKKLLSTTRVSDIGICASTPPPKSQYTEQRSQFEKDLDQIIFSYPFRRLQDKTQVIPFPEFDFVHTRLTHSLEVASVGRSFGKMVSQLIFNEEEEYLKSQEITTSDIGTLVSAACLAHDIGNPPFGHSGEDSISYYFQNSGELMPEFLFGEFVSNDEHEYIYKLERNRCIEHVSFSVEEYAQELKLWNDLSKYEGNANGFRILTQNCEKGINPSVALLGTFTKYPRESHLFRDPSAGKTPIPKSQSKYGFFQSEKLLFTQVANELGLIPINGISELDIAFHRHPLSFLMEASDDIAYGMIDFEDGCRLNLIDFGKHYGEISIKDKKGNVYNRYQVNTSPKEILISIAEKDSSFDLAKVDSSKEFKDCISYLRSKAINVLVHECFNVFCQNYEAIMKGEYDKALIDDIDNDIKMSLGLMKVLIKKYVYNFPPVLYSEASGFEVIYELINSLAISSGVCYSCGDEEDAKQSKLSSLLPEEYLFSESAEGTISFADRYGRMLKILDYISGMTDNYAISIYRKIKGITLHNR